MAGLANTFSGSQDILFPEDAPTHYDSSESVYYSPPSNSSYSSYTQEVKYIFPPEPSSLEYSEHPLSHSPGMDRLRRRSLQSIPLRDAYMNTPRDMDPPPVLTLSPVSRNLDFENGHEKVPRVSPYDEKHLNNNMVMPSKLYKPRPPMLDSRASSSSSGVDRKSPRASKTPEIDSKIRVESPKHGRGDNLFYRSIPEQELYAPLHGKIPEPSLLPRRPPPPPTTNWCRVSRLEGSINNNNIKKNPRLEGSVFATRRKTWSPPLFSSHSLSCASNLSAIRCYRSNEQLDCTTEDLSLTEMSGNDHLHHQQDEESVYEDIDSVLAPPQITPVSGILNKNSQKLLIKPVAFKPVMTPRTGRYNHNNSNASLAPLHHSSTLPASLSSPRRCKNNNNNTGSNTIDFKSVGHSPDDGYASQEYSCSTSSSFHSHSTSNTSSQNSSYHQVTDPERSMNQGESGSISNSNTIGLDHLGLGGASASTNGVGGGGGGGGASGGLNHHGASTNGHWSSAPTTSTTTTVQTTTSSSGHQHHQTDGSHHHLQQHHPHPLPTHHHLHHHHQTPSPSDSGVGELESILRDKDAEIQHLRETMEHNETVIFQVYEEKRQKWSMQLKEVTNEWEQRMHHHQDKYAKMEQTLLLQLYKLQQEKNGLRLDSEQLRAEQNKLLAKCNETENENKTLMGQLEDQQWETAQKAGEVSLLKAQLKDAKETTVSKSTDLLSIKTQLKDFEDSKTEREKESQYLKDEVKRLTQEVLNSRSELEKLRRIMGRPKSDRLVQTEESRILGHASGVSLSSQSTQASASPVPGTQNDNNEKTQISESPVVGEGEEAQVEAQFMDLQERYEKEKEQWLIEKDKVINYQKHLQLNYVQMFRKNKMLELEMEQLMVELENKELTLSERMGSEASDGFESTC